MTTFVVLYVTAAVFWMLVAGTVFADSTAWYQHERRRRAARYALAAPIWPLPLAWLIVQGVIVLVRAAFGRGNG